MSYREVQRANSTRRQRLSKEDQTWLKENGFRNLGWTAIIALYEKIDELLDKQHLGELSLGELFLEADRIGNKYLTTEEIEAHNQQLATVANDIDEEIDRQFPDTDVEVIDFGRTAIARSHSTGKRNKRKR
ncbi:hypothetical protein ACQ4M4_27115 [Leptolyngbya sp. AN02str]|uniref:hypothetical protein n=1 Tax=Leptolyngbya sp. AN02str TaxID=3423363 RepID=UPI003D318A92